MIDDCSQKVKWESVCVLDYWIIWFAFMRLKKEPMPPRLLILGKYSIAIIFNHCQMVNDY